MARVTLEGVRKQYENGHVAVHGVDLEVRDGEFLVLVGPSGCGKSTLLRMIAGLESLTAGRLTIGERVVDDLPPKERDIAMVFQNYALYPHMSVFENMAFALRLRKLSDVEVDRRVREAAAILGTESILDRKPRQLSGGQRQRVAIGRAIVRQPQVFLFDEPLSNLDAKLRVQMRREIAKLHRQLHATIVYVTHDQVEAMTLGDRIVVLSEGRVMQVGRPLELYDRPSNRFVAGFIGSPAMNFIDGVVRANGGMRFVADEGVFELDLGAAKGAMSGLDGRGVTLGIRPEDVYVAAGPPLPVPTARAIMELDAVEPLGNEILLHASAGPHEVTARVTPQPLPEVGQPIELAFGIPKLHVFDPKTQEAVGYVGGAA